MSKRPLDFFGPEDWTGGDPEDDIASIKAAQAKWDEQHKRGLNIAALVMLFVRLAVVSIGIGVMYLEGQEHASPGVWFVVGMVCIVLAVVPWTWEKDQ